MPEMKKCSKCGEEFPATTEYFYARKGAKDGLRRDCRACVTERNLIYAEKNKVKVAERKNQWYKNNKERIAVRAKEYRDCHKEQKLVRDRRYRERNRDKVSAYFKKYRENNKEKIAELGRVYSEKTKERRSAYKKKYFQENREKCGLKRHEYMAKRRKLPSMLTISQWVEIKLHFDNSCAYCGEKSPLQKEHFFPLSKGGEFTINNILPSCQFCNCSKGDKLFIDWYPNFKHYSKKREKKILEYLNYHNGVQQLALM